MQFDFAAGALYACSKNESFDWEKRHAYQFFHFKMQEVADEYFRVTYQLIAVQNLPLPGREAVVDEHRKIWAERTETEESGFDAVGKALTCDTAMALASEVMKFQK